MLEKELYKTESSTLTNTFTMQLPFTNFSDGIYILNVKQQNHVISRQSIINKETIKLAL
ncbi:hypothetical protein KH5_11050 [Urechidicola sp. KH5]